MSKSSYQQLPSHLLSNTLVHNRSRQPKSAQRWVPKTQKMTTLNTIPETNFIHHHPTTIIKKWIPKTVLQAQGYYKGNTTLWLPKKSNKLPAQVKSSSKLNVHVLKMAQEFPQLPITLQHPTLCNLIPTLSKQVVKPHFKPIQMPSTGNYNPTTTTCKSFSILDKALLLQKLFSHAIPPEEVIKLYTQTDYLRQKCQSKALACQNAQQG